MIVRRYDFSVESPLSCGQVLEALTDFSDRRPRYFSNLSAGTYSVLERGDAWARVREGTGPFFSVERYTWSPEGRIWSVIEDSNVSAPGGITDVRVSARADGGSLVRVHMERDFRGLAGLFLLFSASLNGGSRFFRRTYVRVLRNIARETRRERRKA